MNILVLNGSPKGEKSNTYQLTKAFIEGVGESGEAVETREMAVNRLNIRPCLGCFSCWNKTPGKCCMADDMAGVIENMLWSDVTVWSFPLYFFSVPGPLKNLIDRQLPMVLPFMAEDGGETGSGGHPARYDMNGKRTVVISTCGFYTAQGNYDGVCSLFDHICGRGNYTALFCGQGELFRVPELKGRTEEYLGYVRQAGREYIDGISDGTWEKLGQLLYPRNVFEDMADASWGVNRETGEKETDTLIFTRQMATLYNKESWPGHDLVLEMSYTDVNERYQVVLGREGGKVLTENFRAPTTTVETPVTVWRSISMGEISGSEALMRRQYRVEGDFNLLMNWDAYFSGAGGGEAKKQKKPASTGGIHTPSKPTTLNILLIPWIVFWAGASIHSFWGSIAGLCACALVPLWFYQNQKTIYDALSGALVTGFSVSALAGAPIRLVIPLAYLSFGIMWTVSCFFKIPLTARYSMNDYGGEEALENPLFIKTNRILTLAWGVLYLVTPIWTYFILGTGIGGWIGAVNSILPVFMGMFTAWFQKWYPAKFARG